MYSKIDCGSLAFPLSSDHNRDSFTLSDLETAIIEFLRGMLLYLQYIYIGWLHDKVI